MMRVLRRIWEPVRDEEAHVCMERLLQQGNRKAQNKWHRIAQIAVTLVRQGAEHVDLKDLTNDVVDSSAVSKSSDLIRNIIRPVSGQDDCLRLGSDLGETDIPRSSPDFWFGGKPWIGAWACALVY